MKLSQFKFKLPEEQIALDPSYHRDECRLMILHRKSKKIDMYRTDENGEPLKDKDGSPVFLDFRNVLEHFDEGDTFIFNDTKVFPARLFGTKEKTDAKIEVFLLRELNEEMRLWDVLVEPARKIRIGNKLFFDDSGTMVADANLHMILLRCESCDAAVHLVLCGKKPSHFHSIGRRGHARLSQVLLTDNIRQILAIHDIEDVGALRKELRERLFRHARMIAEAVPVDRSLVLERHDRDIGIIVKPRMTDRTQEQAEKKETECNKIPKHETPPSPSLCMPYSLERSRSFAENARPSPICAMQHTVTF